MRKSTVLLCLFLTSVVASAATTDDRLLACGANEKAAERLACFDALVADLTPSASERSAAAPAATATTATTAADVMPGQQSTAEAEEAQFGVEHHQSNKSTSEISAVVTALDRNAVGGLVLTLDNDQIWQQSDRVRIQVPVGTRVIISRGAMSAFYLRIDGSSRRVRFARVR